jgi:hypothetical protein
MQKRKHCTETGAPLLNMIKGTHTRTNQGHVAEYVAVHMSLMNQRQEWRQLMRSRDALVKVKC